VLNLVFEAFNRISLEVHHCRFNSNRGNLAIQSFLHCHPFVLASLIDALMFAACIEAFFAMVRRHGKRTALAREEKKKRERGESSTSLNRPGPHAPKRQRGEEQRVRVSGPGSLFLSLLI
jgi:hypothetical protein